MDRVLAVLQDRPDGDTVTAITNAAGFSRCRQLLPTANQQCAEQSPDDAHNQDDQ